MSKKATDMNYTEGLLPAVAPLANGFVPYQQPGGPKYEARKALVRGTLFPGLDLPFLGMVNQTEKPVTPLTELQTMDFAIQELALYLDTHRDDQEAFDLYRQFQTMYQEARGVYEMEYGPLTHCSPTGDRYKWLCDPWPWEYAENKEG